MTYNKTEREKTDMFKMMTFKGTGMTIIVRPGTNGCKIFDNRHDAFLYMDIMKSVYYRRSRRNIASEPYPVRSLIPNLATKIHINGGN